MNSREMKTKSYSRAEFQNLPKFEIKNKTYWYRWLFIPIISTIFGLIFLQFLLSEEMRNIFTYLCILYGFLLIVPTILGYFQKK
ncbi:MAG: hypothetical protein ACXACB_00360, partial [Promethearchaeota archaeon]